MTRENAIGWRSDATRRMSAIQSGSARTPARLTRCSGAATSKDVGDGALVILGGRPVDQQNASTPALDGTLQTRPAPGRWEAAPKTGPGGDQEHLAGQAKSLAKSIGANPAGIPGQSCFQKTMRSRRRGAWPSNSVAFISALTWHPRPRKRPGRSGHGQRHLHHEPALGRFARSRTTPSCTESRLTHTVCTRQAQSVLSPRVLYATGYQHWARDRPYRRRAALCGELAASEREHHRRHRRYEQLTPTSLGLGSADRAAGRAP